MNKIAAKNTAQMVVTSAGIGVGVGAFINFVMTLGAESLVFLGIGITGLVLAYMVWLVYRNECERIESEQKFKQDFSR
jgi:hypothetical protein